MATNDLMLQRGHLTLDINKIYLGEIVLREYRPAVAKSKELTVDDVIPIIIKETPDDTEELVFKIEAFFNEVSEYANDKTYPWPIFLKRMVNNAQYFSLIRDAVLVPIDLIGGSTTLGESETGTVTTRWNLEITRDNFWEASTMYWHVPTGNPLSAWGGFSNYTNTKGSLPSRIHSLLMSRTSGSYYNVWVGIRKIRQGNTNFNPLVEIEDGTISEGTYTTFVADGGYSGGGYMQTVFNNENLIERAYVKIGDVVSYLDLPDMVGKYLVLARAMVTGTAEVGIQLQHGTEHALWPSFTAEREIAITNTTMKPIPLGVVQIPPWAGSGRYPQYETEAYVEDEIQDFSLRIWAELISGSGNLIVDGFCLVPQDASVVINSPVPMKYFSLNTRYDGEPVIEGETFTSGTVMGVNLGLANWQMPPGDGTIVFVDDGGITNVNNLYIYWAGKIRNVGGVYDPPLTI